MSNEIKKVPVVLDNLVDEKTKENIMKEITGVKEEVSNLVALKDLDKNNDDNFEYPSLFISNNDVIKVYVQVLFDSNNGKPIMMNILRNLDVELPELKYLKRTIEWVEFTIPSYDDMVSYRESSLSYDSGTNKFLSDPIKMRLCYLRYHLKDWSIKKDGEVVELVRDGSSALTNESMSIIGSINPSMMDIILTEFEREAMLLS